MAKVVITIEDVDGDVNVDCYSAEPIYKCVSPQNTEAQNLGFIAMSAIHEYVKRDGYIVNHLPDVVVKKN